MVATTSHIFSGKVDIASNLQVGSSHLFVDTENDRVGITTASPDATLHVNGNVYATRFEGDGSLLTGIASNLEQITNNGNVTSNAVQFTNPDTGIVTTGNVDVGNKLSVASLTPGSVPYVDGNKTLVDSHITQGTDKVSITSNLEITGNILVSGETYKIDSQSLEVKDRIVGIAYDNTLSGADTGILMEYPTKNIGLIHHGASGNPYAQEFTIGYTQNTATDTTILNDPANKITVNVLGDLHTQNNMTVDSGGSYFGDGTTLTGVALATDMTSNAARIANIETVNASQTGLITGLRADMTSNASRMTTLETANTVQAGLITSIKSDVTSNTARIATLEAANTVQASLITAIETDVTDNAARITTLEAANTVQAGLITAIETDVTDNAARITTLEDANTVQAGLITAIETDVTDNAARITTLEDANTVQAGLITVIETDVTDNAARITTLEAANTVQAGLITAIETDVADNATRITNLDTDLTDNASRVTALEATDAVYSGLLTGLRTDVDDNDTRIVSLESANTVQAGLITTLTNDLSDNAGRITTLEDANTVQAGLITTLTNDLSDNAGRITTLEDANTVQAGLITTLTNDLSDNAGRITTLEDANTVQAGLITTLTNDLSDNAGRITTLEDANTVQAGLITGLRTDLEDTFITKTSDSTIISSNLEVTGNIFMRGDRFVVESETTLINDAIIGIANNNTVSTTDVGILMQRPTANVALVHHGGTDTFTIGYTQDTLEATDITNDTTNEINVNVLGQLHVQNNMTVGAGGSYYGDGSTLTGVALVSDTTSNVTRIANLEASNVDIWSNLYSNVIRIEALEDANTVQAGLITTLTNDLSDNAGRITTLEDANTVQAGLITTLTNDLSDNAGRITTLEDANTVQAGLITTLTNDLSDNAGRITTLEDANTVQAGLITTLTNDLSDNAGRITTLENANTVQAGLITTLTNDLSDNAGRITTLEDANTVQAGLITTLTNDLSDNAGRITTLEDANTVQAGLITTLTSDLSDNAGRITTLEDANTVQAGLITTLTSDLSDNAGRITTLEDANTVQAGLITTLTNDLSDNAARITTLEDANTVQAGLITTLTNDLSDNAGRITTLEDANTVQAGLITTLTNDLSDNAGRITTLEDANTVQAGLITTLTNDLSDNAARIAVLDTDMTSNSGRIDALEPRVTNLEASNVDIWSNLALLTLDDVVNVNNATSNTVRFTNATTSLTASGNVTVSGNVTSTTALISNAATLGTTKEFVVTVSGGVFYIDGVQQLSLELHENQTYLFDLTNPGTSHPFRLATVSDGGGAQNGSGSIPVSDYTTGTDYTSVANHLKFTVPPGAPSTLYYYCTIHSGMGGSVSVSPTAELIVSGRVVASGNVEASSFKGDGSQLTNIASNLQAITDNGNVTSNTVQFTNTGTSLVASGTVEAVSFVGSGAQLTDIASNLEQIVNNGNVTSNTILLTDATTGLVATGNVEALKFIGDGSALTNIASNLEQIANNGNVTSNTLLLTDTTTGLVATGNVHALKFIGDGSALSNLPTAGVWEEKLDGEIYFTASNVGISNADPGHNLSVGSNLYVDDDGSNVLVVAGNVKADYFVGNGSLLTNLPSGSGGVWSTNDDGEIYFINSNVGISNADPGHELSVGSNLYVDDDGSNVLVVTGNVKADYFVGNGSLLTNLPSGSGGVWSTNDDGEIYFINSNVGISNADPGHNLSVGSNLYVDDDGSNVLVVNGNVSVGSTLTLDSFAISVSQGLNDILNVSNTSSNTMQLTNTNVGLVATGNVEANYFIGDGSQLTNIASTLQAITDSGNTTSNAIQFTNADVSLTTSGNVEIGSELSVSSNVEVGTANLFVDTVNSMIGIGTNTPESILHVSDTLTNYKIKPIPLNGAPEGGAYYGYILLAKAATGGIDSESYVVGKLLARRGTTTSGHKLNYYDVVSSRGYNHYEILSVDRVGNRTGNDGFTSTVKVTYNGTVYHALRTGSTGGQPTTDLTFWGSSKDAGLIMVDSSMVSNETAYGSITRSAVNGNVGIGTANPTSLLDVNGTFSVSGPTTGATHSDGGILYLLDTPIIDEWSWTGSTANTLRITYASTELPANCKAVLAEVFMPKSNVTDHVGHSLGKNYSSSTVWTSGNQQPSTRFTLNRQTTFLDMRGDSDNFEYYYGKWFSSVIIPLDTGNTVYHIVQGESSGTTSWVYVVTRGYYI